MVDKKKYIIKLREYFNKCKNRRLINHDFLNILKDLIRLIKSKPDYILNLKIIDDPGREIEIPYKFRDGQIDAEYELRNAVYKYESNTKINLILNNDHFNNLTYMYEKGIRISNDSDPTILDFTPKYKIAGTFFPIKSRWLFSEFYQENIEENDRLNITSEMVYNTYKNQNSGIILKLNSNKDLIKSFNKIFTPKPYYDIPFIYLGSQDFSKSLIRSTIFEFDPSVFLYMISLFEKFHETLVMI